MIIDFHTHIFPDALAPKALKSLKENSGHIYDSITDATRGGLIEYMNKHNIDISVVQPVITKQSQTEKSNLWAQSICSDRLISFGGIYPHTDDYKRDIDFVVSLGLKGLKFHAEYQDFILDDIKMLRIYDYALSNQLIILHHAGFDPAYKAPFRSSPQQFANIDRELKGGVIVAAHLGGQAQWDDVENYLAGTDIYLDTSMGFSHYSKDQFLRILKSHGADRILFASDSPWSDAASEVQHIESLPISDDEKNLILSGNARRILKI